jgi:ADP-ribose pyrophosphatase
MSESPHSLHRGRFLELVVASGGWEFVRRIGNPRSVGIVALTPEGRMILISQYRIPIGKVCVEIPAGLVGDGTAAESWRAGAIRELREETGYTAADMEYLTEGPSSAGLTTECILLARALGVKKVGAPEPDGDEQIEVHEVALTEVPAFLQVCVDRGWIIDPKVYAALYFLSVAPGH